MSASKPSSNTPKWKHRLHEVIFEADTVSGKLFDVLLLIFIVLSVVAVMMESVREIVAVYYDELIVIEWVFTIAFTIEYFLRIIAVKRPMGYILSFYGVIDFLSILPTYLSLVVVGSHSLVVIRMLRLLRVFRIFKLARYTNQATLIVRSLKSSWPKISVFMLAVFSICVIMGTIMYIIEDPESGFTSIPRSIYWAIVTLTTVGYGDISPATPLGQAFASIIMIMGYAIIAVPTGIITSEIISRKTNEELSTQSCPNCAREGHDSNATFCKFCGHPLNS